MKMLIYDVLHKEKVYQIIAGNLRTLGVKYRIKKNAVKTDKPERHATALKKVFKTPLSYLPLDVVNLTSGAIIHVPVFVSQATAFILKNANQEGLFRKAGSSARQKEIISRIDSGGSLGDKNNAIDVANCLKTFFRSLPEPLIPFIYHDLFVRCNMLKTNKIQALLLSCVLLPPHNLNTLAFLMEFLKTVASYEKQNKMSIDNLARVFGPNIMPLQETTMIAVQSRLDAHLNIVKLLIENAESIGVLPEDISEAISIDAVGSVDNELDKTESSSFKSKKKKHRSGSLNRMLSGLKKIVGKNNSPSGLIETSESQLLAVDSTRNLYTPSLKTGKKRKVADLMDSANVKRKHLVEVMPDSTSFGHTFLFSSPVSNNPNPVKEKSPSHKSGVQKYLSNKIHADMKASNKLERPKKHRLSLDRFVPRTKLKISEQDSENRKKSFSPTIGRRWSSTSNTMDTKKRRRTQSIDSSFTSSPQAKIRNSGVDKAFEEVFMDADINLSDDCSLLQISQEISTSESIATCKRVNSLRKSTHSYSLRNSASPNVSTDTVILDPNDKSEEYVKIPKSEYEQIKSRVSAIESRISQEFKAVTSDSSDALTVNPIINVQNEYEKTLEESSIGNTASADQLAKRLSRELKIRRSAENKIIRSPSARKIGILRRRSQEKPISKKVHRTSSWHIPSRTETRDPSLNNYYPKQCNLKRGRPLVKRDSNKSLDRTPKAEEDYAPSFCSEETNARLHYLQQQLNTLISHTAEHTRGSFSDEDFAPLEDDILQNDALSVSSTKPALNSTLLRRASSFHNEFIDNSQYFNNKIKELKKTNSQQNLTSITADTKENNIKKTLATQQQQPLPSRKEKTVSWKDADDYFKQESKTMTPVPTTGRASVAKLRTQNAGMVLAKAKLFDDPTKEAVDVSRRQSMKVLVTARAVKEEPRTPQGLKRHNNDVIIRRRQHHHNHPSRRSPKPVSPLIKMEVTISSNGRRQSTRFNTPRKTHEDVNAYSVQKENQLIQNANTPIKTPSKPPLIFKQQDNINIFKPNESPMCRTPHIKRPLGVKTPRSAKSLSARKSAMMSRRTPLKATLPITPKRQSPRIVMKSSQLGRHIN